MATGAPDFAFSFCIPRFSFSPRRPRRAVVLIIVLIVVVVLALAAYTFTELMITHREATEHAGRQAQARLLVDTGVDSVRRFLMQDKITQFEAGGIYNNPMMLQAQLVLDDPDPNLRGRFTVMAPLLDDEGYPGGLRYGLENESARININALLWLESQPAMQGAGRALLMALPNMTEDVADAIMDYIDEDSEPREYGAEDEYYFELDPPYLAKNAPLDTVEELLLVRGVTPQLLFGADANRNGMLDPGEAAAAAELEATAGTAMIETTFGSMDRGWSAYLTLWSMEKNANAVNEPRIYINQDDMQQLYDQLSMYFDESWARFIVAYRQYGPAGGNGNNNRGGDDNGNQGDGGNDGGNRGDDQEDGNGGQDDGNGGGDSAAASLPATAIPLDLTQPGQHKITQILELIGAKIAIPTDGGNGNGNNGNSNGNGNNQNNNGGGDRQGGGNQGGNQGAGNQGGGNQSGGNQGGGNQQGGDDRGGDGNQGGNNQGGGGGQENQEDSDIYESPFADEIFAMGEYLPMLLDHVSVNRNAWIPGRININQAPWAILANIPGMSPEIADQIIANREMSDAAEETDPNRRFETWILTSGIVTLQEMRTLTPFITAGGDVYRAQIVGYYEDGGASSRAEVVIDATQSTPRVLFWRDISHLGRGHALETLGVEAAQAF